MNAAVTVKHEPHALVLNEMVFGLHAIAMPRSFADRPAEGSIAIQIGSAELTQLAVNFHLSCDEARELADALTTYAALAESKCAQLDRMPDTREHYESMAREAGAVQAAGEAP